MGKEGTEIRFRPKIGTGEPSPCPTPRRMITQMNDVTALGEILIDFTLEGQNEIGVPLYTANPGGAPGNVLASLAQLGKKTELISCVGNDQFGRQLESSLQEKRINTSGLVYSCVPTTLAFVHIGEDGDRSFSFYRNPGADMMLTKEDLNLQLISNSKIFHVGSISMTHNPAREATITALSYAKENNIFISFDPNLRPPLWESLEEAKRNIKEIMTYADIVKVSKEELEFLTGKKEIESAAKEFYNEYKLFMLFVTSGSTGSYLFYKGKSAFFPSFSVNVVDTTGCGDAFFGGVLYQILENNFLSAPLSIEDLYEILKFGNAMGAFVAQFKGGIPSMPTPEQIQNFIAKHK